jgi:tetratricopeptide (TPR) repeat protein
MLANLGRPCSARLALGVIAFAAVLVLAGCGVESKAKASAQRSEAEVHIYRATGLSLKGHKLEALVEYALAELACDGFEHGASVHSAMIVKQLGEEEVLSGLRSLMSEQPENQALHATLGLVLLYRLERDRAADAIGIADDAIARWPEEKALFLLRGHARRELEEHRLAAADYARALDLGANLEETTALRCNSLLRDGQVDSAQAEMERVFGGNPDHYLYDAFRSDLEKLRSRE